MERALIEYLANSAWQLPLLAGGAWLLLRIARLEPLAQHWVWVVVLAAAVVLPLPGMVRSHAAAGPADAGQGAAQSAMAPTSASLQSQNTVGQREERWASLVAEMQNVHLNATEVQWLIWLYVTVVLLGGLRLIWAWAAARRLMEHSREVFFSGPVLERFESYGQRLGVELPKLRGSSDVLSPVVVGTWKPVLLLPENFLEHTEEEIQAALCHELAHVRRRDTLATLLCEAAALPLIWHPAAYAVQGRIRSTREMVCDAMAAAEMRSEIGYAKCLMALARRMAGGYGSVQTQGLGLFDNNTLEERVMRLTKAKIEKSARVRIARAACGAAVMMAAIAMAAMFHVTPTLAEAQSASPAPAAVERAPAAPRAESGKAAPTAIGHGKGASVIAGKGEYIHRWTELDGKRVVMVDHQRQEPTLQERRRFERKLARLAKNLPELQQQVKSATAQLDNPEFKKQMAGIQKQIQSGELQRSVQMAAMHTQLKAMNMTDIQRQMKDAAAHLDSRELEQQMAEVQKAVQKGELQREKAIQILKDAETQLEKMQMK